MLRFEEGVAARLVKSATETEPATSELMLSGAGTGLLLPGAVLEGAIRWGNCRLLFLTHDVPYEEALEIVMLDARVAIVDAACIGGMYTTGSFRSPMLEQPDVVEFEFIGDTVWSVQLLPRAVRRIPFLSEPKGVHRKFGFSRRFIVSGRPMPNV